MKKLVFSIFMILFCISKTISQTQASCGIYRKAPPPTNTGIISQMYSDRFGNQYSTKELYDLSFQYKPFACSSGFFELEFDGNFSQDQMNVICSAFKEISQNITKNIEKPKIKVTKEQLEDGVLAVGSAYYLQGNACTFLQGQVFSKINTNDKSTNPEADGFITFNINIDDKDWHTDLTTQPDSKHIDMFSVALHEALHTMGFASSITDNGQALNGIYSIWDKYLFIQNQKDFLIDKKPDAKCCNDFQINKKISFPQGILTNCNSTITLGSNGSTNINSEYVSSMFNTLSHLCDNKLVMYPYFGYGQKRKNLSKEELEILCKLGYSVGSCTKNDCIIQANDDYFATYSSSGTGKSLWVIADILKNDLYTNTNATFSSNSPNISINKGVVNGLTYISISGLLEGNNIINYEITSCDGLCSQAKIIIYRPYILPPNTTNSSSCNLVINGDFEDISKTEAFEDVKLHSLNGVTNSPDWFVGNSSNTIKNGFFPESASWFCNNTFTFSPLKKFIVPSKTINSAFIQFANDDTYLEAMYFPLKEALVIGETYDFSFDKFSGCANSLNFAFSENRPCPQSIFSSPAIFGNPQQTVNCGSYKYDIPQIISKPFSGNVKQWDNLTGSFVANKAAKFLIIYPSFESIYADRSYFFDNIAVSKASIPKGDITATLIKQCIGGKVEIKYKICVPPTTVSPINITLTPSFTPSSVVSLNSTLGNFTAGVDNVTLPFNGQYCIERTLVLDVKSTVLNGTILNVSLDYVSKDICFSNNGAVVTPITLTSGIAPATAKFTFKIICPNQLEVTPDYTGDTHEWILTDAQGKQVAISSNITNLFTSLSNGMYSIKHTITNDCGSISEVKDITIDCTSFIECTCTKPAYNIQPLAGQNEILLSTTQLYIDNPVTFKNVGGCITISGKLIIDREYNFDDGKIIMQPGSEIEVQKGFKLTIANAYLHSCNRMWKGITLLNGADIKIFGATIEDALYAVRCKANNKGDISNSKFNKNYVGFYADGIPVATQKAVNVILSNNEFYCNGTLLPYFEATAINIGTTTYAGILANYAAFEVGLYNLTKSENKFHDIQNGVVTYESAGSMHYPNIYNLIKNAPYDPNDIVLTSGTTGKLNHYGMYLGGSSWDIHDAKINQVTNGIRLFGSRDFWIDNSTINSVAGIYNISSKGYFLVQRNNILTNTNYGIRSYESANQLTSIGFDGAGAANQQNIFNGLNTFFDTRGIAIDISSFTPNPIAQNKGIRSNIINISTDYDGINVNRDNNYAITNNDINYSLGEKYAQGLLLQSTSNHYVWGNNIIANTPVQGTAITMSGASTNNIFCCNQTNNTTDGISFSGAMAAGTALRNTVIGNHTIGLKLTSGTIIGPQIHAGNRFNGPFDSYSAIFQGNPNQNLRTGSRFEINPPQGTPIFPTGVVPTSSWFRFNIPGTTATCTTDLTCIPVPFKKSAGGKVIIPELVLAFAQEKFSDDTYGKSNQWEGSRWVLQEIEKNPEWLGIDESLDKFYDWASKSNLQRFNDIDKIMSVLKMPNDVQQAILDEVVTNTEILRKQIEQTDTQLSVMPEKEDSVLYMNLRGEYLERLYMEFERAKEIYESIEAQKSEKIATIAKINTNIATDNIFEKNEQQINAIYLNTLAADKYELSNTEQEIVSMLAHQCFREAGSAVHKARVLYNLFALPDFDDAKCEKETKEVPFYSKVVKSSNGNTINIYPNPAYDIINIDAKIENGTVILRDITGKIIGIQVITGKTVVPIAHISNGIIFCEIWSQDNKITTQKIVIIR